MRIPDEFTEAEKVSGMWWRQLVAGGGAGVGKISLDILTSITLIWIHHSKRLDEAESFCFKLYL